MNDIKKLRPYQQECLDALRKRLKEVKHPLLVNASVGAGKSLIIASLLHIIEKANWRALCLTMNSTLIQQNAETYESQGGNPGIYCSGLKQKNISSKVIFGSPHSVLKAIRGNKKLADIPFNLIVVDECHGINHHNNASMYMRILNHYGMMHQSERHPFRVVGLTGTPYRGKSISIVGPDEYFKEEVCSISSAWLIEQGYLVPPIFGKTELPSFDMKNVRLDKMGKFKYKDLQSAVDKSERLTGQIMQEVIEVVENGRSGAFIFASTLKHAAECMRSLPIGQSAFISGDTPHEERKEILQLAKAGIVKYLVNVATLLVGVDIPNFDVCAWLRPTESLVLYTQGIGRVLRLSHGKKNSIILDYAGNLERHGDIDDPMINAALQPEEKDDPEYCIKCHACFAMNKETARRCIGTIDGKRCEHFFLFKACNTCETSNDITSRECRKCGEEMIDPNKKLNFVTKLYMMDVLEAKYWITVHNTSSSPVIHVRYQTNNGFVYENFYTGFDKSKQILYARFIKLHIPNASEYWPHMNKLHKMREMIEGEIWTPTKIICKLDKYNRFSVVKKIFNLEDCKTSE